MPAADRSARETKPLDVAVLTEILAGLGRSVSGAQNGPPQVTAVHLTRVLVAAAEQQAIAAELALAREYDGVLPDDAQVGEHQDTYDLAAARGAVELLAVCYWRAQRFSAGIQAVAATFKAADSSGGDPEANPLARMWDLAVPAAGYCSRRMSTSRSTKVHSSVARSMATSSSNPASSAGANSNHVRKSNGSPRSRLWWSRRATAGRYFRPMAMWWESSSKISRRSSCDSAHHACDFLIGMRAALVASRRPRRGERAASSTCSRLSTYLS